MHFLAPIIFFREICVCVKFFMSFSCLLLNIRYYEKNIHINISYHDNDQQLGCARETGNPPFHAP